MYRPLVILFYKLMAFVLSFATSVGLITVPDAQTPLTVDETAELTFAVFGDCQVSNVMYARELSFYAACEDLGNTRGVLDALVIVGDIAENGLQSEYATVRDILNQNSNAFNAFLAVEGNHDVRSRVYSLQMKRFCDFVNSVDKSVPLPEGKYNYTYDINGYRFIVLGTDSTQFEESELSEAQLIWLDEQIAETQASGRPVFVFAHQPLQNTHGLPGTWNAPEFLKAGSIGAQNDEVKAIFEKYDNVIFISGHLHTGVGEYTYEDYGAFKSFNVPGVSMKNADGIQNNGQGLVFSVYNDKIVMRARIFGEGRYVDESVTNALVEIPLGE